MRAVVLAARLRASDVKQRCRTARNRSPDGAERNPGTDYQLQCPSWVSLRSTQATKNKGKRNAGRRGIPRPVRKRRTGRATEDAACAALPLSGALACRRSTTALAAATERHRSAPVHALPGTGLVRDGRYPPPAVPVQRAYEPAGRSSVPAGRFGPEPPGSGGDSPARGNRTRPSPPASPGGVPSGRDDSP